VPVDAGLSPEEVVIGLTCPRAHADGRIFKLRVRLFQDSDLDLDRLEFLARREGASRVLHWLLSIVPAGERTPKLEAVAAKFALPPRGYRGTDYLYDPSRLLRKRGGDRPWQRKQN
jgi:hypothetical protein